MSEPSDQPRSLYFDVSEGSEDERLAPLDPDPTGRSRPPGVMEYFAGRNGRRVMVSNPETDGLSFTIFTFAPGTTLPKHRHNVDYIELVLAGEVHHGNRVLGPGQGVFRTAGTPYSFWAGPEGATIADFRAHTFYTTEYQDPPDKFPPHRL
ncbi:MAG TPA: hypothetical protein VGI44_14535 [Acidimicrobiales bacterium]